MAGGCGRQAAAVDVTDLDEGAWLALPKLASLQAVLQPPLPQRGCRSPKRLPGVSTPSTGPVLALLESFGPMLALPGRSARWADITEAEEASKASCGPTGGDFCVEQIAEKVVRVPVERMIKKVVQFPHPVPIHVEIPVPHEVMQVPYLVQKVVDRPIPYPMERVIEQPVPYPVQKVVGRPVPYPMQQIVKCRVDVLAEVKV